MTQSQFLRGTLILTAAGMVVKAIGSLNWIILSRVLGGEGIGLYQLAFPVYLLALSISSAGIPVAISIMTAEKVVKGDDAGALRIFKLSLGLLTVTGLVLSAALYFGAEWLITYRFIRDPRAYYSLIALAPAIFFVTILSSFRGYLQGRQIMTPTAVSQIVEQLVRVGAMLLFASIFLPKGLEYAAGGASFGAGFGGFAALIVLVFYFWRIEQASGRQGILGNSIERESNRELIRRLIHLALPVSLSSIMLPIVANLDLFIVPARLELAGYAVEQATELFGYLTGMAVPLVNLFTILTASLATSLVPAVSEAYSIGDRMLTYQRTAAAMRLTNLVTIPGTVILWQLAEPIATLIYHAPRAGEPIKVLAIGVFLLGIHQVTTGILQGMGRTAIPVLNMVLAAVVKVILNWTLTAMPEMGIKGAALSTVADIGVAAILNMYFVHRYTGFTIDLISLAKSGIAAGVMGCGIFSVYKIAGFASVTSGFTALLAFILGGLIYLIVLLLCGGINTRDIQRVPVIGDKITDLILKTGLGKK